MTTLFISDLHLSEERPEITRAFYSFLDTKAAHSEALYILGDFFEVWIGDDDDAPFAAEVTERLRQFSARGIPLFFMVGNRDFLVGETFAQRCGATLLDELTVIDLYGTPTLLLHGDTLCTADQEYMAFRQLARSQAWQAELLAKPLEERRAIAQQLRQQSKSMSSMKAEDIMDVTREEVLKDMQRHNVKRMIHGHTHRPAVHTHTLADDQIGERMVLGDWGADLWWIEASENSPPALMHEPL